MCKRVGAKVFLRVSRDGKFFSLDLPQTVKKGCALAVRCGGVWNLWSQAKKLFEFVIWSWGKHWDILLVAIGECLLCRLLTAKFRSVRGLSQQPAFMDNCLKISRTYLFCPSTRWDSPSHRPNILCSWNIRGTFPWYSPGIFGKSSIWNSREYSQIMSGNIEYRNTPWMFHEYRTNVTCIFLGGSKNAIVVFSKG